MKKLFIISVILSLAFVTRAQESMFAEGNKQVNIGLGLGYYNSLSASLDYCIADSIADKGSIGVGPYIGFGIRPYYNAVLGGARGTFHYPVIEKFDTYIGFGVGATYNMYNRSYWGSYYSNWVEIEGGFFLGANYPLNEKFTVFGEIGYGINYLNVGLVFNL